MLIFEGKDERERRKNNSLILWVRQGSHDANVANKQVQTIFNKIGIEPRVIAHSSRFRRSDPIKPEPIFVRLSECTDRY